MNVREAKDFLVQQTVEQAALDHVPFSDLEKRMMYFTETDEMPEDPIELNSAFEAKYDSDEYEAKVSRLMGHAHARLKKENPFAAKTWKEAVHELQKGDHYILLLSNATGHIESGARPPHDSLKLIGTGLLVAILGVAALWGWGSLSRHFHGSLPVWLQRLLLISLIGVYAYFALLPMITKKPAPGISQLFSYLLAKRSRAPDK